MSVEKDFRTCDLYFAAYLKAIGVPFRGLVKVRHKAYFIFDNAENLRELKDAYFCGKAQVGALAISDALRALKRLCHMP